MKLSFGQEVNLQFDMSPFGQGFRVGTSRKRLEPSLCLIPVYIHAIIRPHCIDEGGCPAPAQRPISGRVQVGPRLFSGPCRRTTWRTICLHLAYTLVLPPCLGLMRGLKIQLRRGNLFVMIRALTYHLLSVFNLAFRGQVSVSIGSRQAFESHWTL